MIRTSKIAVTYETEILRLRGNEDEFRFRIDIFEDELEERFFTRVWFIEMHNIQPTFPQDKLGNSVEEICGQTILVLAPHPGFRITGKTASALLASVLDELAKNFIPIGADVSD